MDGPPGGEQGGDVPLQAGAGRLHGHHPVPEEADREETHSHTKSSKFLKNAGIFLHDPVLLLLFTKVF